MSFSAQQQPATAASAICHLPSAILSRFSDHLHARYPDPADTRPTSALANFRNFGWADYNAPLHAEIAAWYEAKARYAQWKTDQARRRQFESYPTQQPRYPFDPHRHESLIALLWHIEGKFGRDVFAAPGRQQHHLHFGAIELAKFLCRAVEATRQAAPLSTLNPQPSTR